VSCWGPDSLACSVASEVADVVLPIETVSVPRPFSKFRPLSIRNYTNLICIQPCSPVALPTKFSADSATFSEELPTIKAAKNPYWNVGLLNVRSLSTKAVLINDLMSECSLDLIGLTETWLKPDEYSPLNEASPPDFAYSHIPRVSKKGGGVAMIYEASFNLSLKSVNTFKSFEIICMKPPTTLKRNNATTPAPPPSFCIVTLYRHVFPLPGGICRF